MSDFNIIENVSRIVYDYSNMKIFLDSYAINKVIELFMHQYTLYGYINGIEYMNGNNKEKNCYCSYNYKLKKIMYNYNKNLESIIQKDLGNQEDKNSKDMFLRINLAILSDIMRELIHVIQHKNVDSGEKNLENLLLSISFESNLIDEEMLTPAERMANIGAANHEFEISKKLNFKLSNKIKNYSKEKLFKAHTNGYSLDSECNSPTINYIKKVGEGLKTSYYDTYILICELSQLSETMSFVDKLYYGLQLNKHESNKIKRVIKKN